MNNLNFRAWHKELKDMEPVLLMCFVNQYVNVLPARNLQGGSQEQWNFKDVVLMQSTGRKDCEGVEIFDGDVVKDSFYDEIFIIKYDISRGMWFGIDHFNEPVWEFPEDLESEEICIIGNIHQNPELLEVGDE